MSKSRFVAKIIAPLALILLTLIGAPAVYGVFLQIKVALTAKSYGFDGAVAVILFVEDIKNYQWLHGRASLADLRYLADARLAAIRKEFPSEN